MVYFLGLRIPADKKILIALTYFFGIGINYSKNILNELRIDFNKKVEDLDKKEILDIKKFLSKIENKIEVSLKRKIQNDIRNLKEIYCFRGYRHFRRLPARGQRTRTNSRTNRLYRRKRPTISTKQNKSHSSN